MRSKTHLGINTEDFWSDALFDQMHTWHIIFLLVSRNGAESQWQGPLKMQITKQGIDRVLKTQESKEWIIFRK